MNLGRAAIYVACTVTTVWAISTMWSIVHPRYQPDPSIHSIMLTVAGAFLGVGIVQKRRDNDSGERDSRDEADLLRRLDEVRQRQRARKGRRGHG